MGGGICQNVVDQGMKAMREMWGGDGECNI